MSIQADIKAIEEMQYNMKRYIKAIDSNCASHFIYDNSFMETKIYVKELEQNNNKVKELLQKLKGGMFNI